MRDPSHSTRKKSSISALQVPNSGTVTEDVQKADILNNQFFSNFNHSVPSLSSFDVRDICNLGSLESSNFPEEFRCTEDQVLDLICSLDSTKATGADDISARMLMATALSVSKVSLTCSTNPCLWGSFSQAGKLLELFPFPG